jgi:hypothetical protein
VALSAGLGTGSVLVEGEVPGTPVITWHGAGAPRNRVPFEVPIANPVTFDVLASAGNDALAGTSQITACSPGSVGHTSSAAELQGTACRLNLSPAGPSAGRASFGP